MTALPLPPTPRCYTPLSEPQINLLNRIEELSYPNRHDGWVRIALLPKRSMMVCWQLVQLRAVEYRKTPVGPDFPGQSIRWVRPRGAGE